MDFVNKETFLWVGDESENKETREEKKASGGMRSLLLYFFLRLVIIVYIFPVTNVFSYSYR